MRVGYGKIGRVVEVNPAKWGESGGDNEPPALLLTLAVKHPEVTWVVFSKNSGWVPPLPNIENPWQEWSAEVKAFGPTSYRNEDQSPEACYRTVAFYDELITPIFDTFDGIVTWIGQHGSSSRPIPSVKNQTIYTKPLISSVHYASHSFTGINRWRNSDPIAREEVWLIADVRNYIKARDLKWPRRHPILGQFDFTRSEKMERYGDPRSPDECGFRAFTAPSEPGLWRADDVYTYAGVELVGIRDAFRDQWLDWEERDRFGVIINEARGYAVPGGMDRLSITRDWILPMGPSWVHGTWSKGSLETLATTIKPIPYTEVYEYMMRAKSTFTTPSSGSQWATAKPWEAFSAGLICFFHPMYDTQGHIIPTLQQVDDDPQMDPNTAALARWLRVRTPDELRGRIDAVHSSRETYEWLRDAQYDHLQHALMKQQCVTSIERRLGL